MTPQGTHKIAIVFGHLPIILLIRNEKVHDNVSITPPIRDSAWKKRVGADLAFDLTDVWPFITLYYLF